MKFCLFNSNIFVRNTSGKGPHTGLSLLSRELDKWVGYYNRSYLHSALGYRAPAQAQEDYYKKREDTLLTAIEPCQEKLVA
jgi:transposase InsO family protein